MQRRTVTLAAAAILSMGYFGRVQAQDSAQAARALATNRGTDRTDKLLELSKREGELSVYHVYPALPAVIAAFTKKYGFKVKAWRSSSETVLQRAITESRGNRFEVDVIQNNAPEAEAAYREKLSQEVWSAGQSDLIAAAVPAHLHWAGISLDIWTAAYNTNLVKKEELPKSYADLLDPRWKGRLGIEANNHIWFHTLLGELGEAQGVRLFDQLMAGNGLTARKGHSVLVNLVASGEVPLALTAYSWIAEQLKKKGAPIENWPIQPLLAQPSTIAVARTAPNPATALLFYDFMLGEGQKVLAEAQFVPASKSIPNPLTGVPMKLIDPARALDQQEKWVKGFDDMVVRRAK